MPLVPVFGGSFFAPLMCERLICRFLNHVVFGLPWEKVREELVSKPSRRDGSVQFNARDGVMNRFLKPLWVACVFLHLVSSAHGQEFFPPNSHGAKQNPNAITPAAVTSMLQSAMYGCEAKPPSPAPTATYLLISENGTAPNGYLPWLNDDGTVKTPPPTNENTPP